MTMQNCRWVLNRFPDGAPVPECWRRDDAAVPEPQDGEALVRAIYLSVDPYLRGRISKAANYAAGVQIGEVMHGGGVGVVEKSRSSELPEGTIVEGFGFGWQDYSLQKPDAVRVFDPSLGPLHASLSYLGMPGITAYMTMIDTIQIKQGDVAVVSAASGAVGQIAGQIARIKGASAVAVAGSDEKIAWCKELGYSDGINYKTADDLPAAVKAACPDGVDAFLDNTAGPIHDAVMLNLALGARIAVCGTMDLSNRLDEPDMGRRFLRQILTARARMQGFLIFDHMDRFDSVRREIAGWAKDGLIRHREDIMEGIESVPEAFLRLLTGKNFGKQLIRISEGPGGIG